ncbi:hypothetical protein LCGC14_2822320, partial [marine sediment metagenome]
NNTHYDNSGTLTLMINNRWANHFVYLEPDDHIIFVFGREQFVTEAQAENEDVPSSSLPTRITETSILIGRFTFQKSDNTATILTNFPPGIFNSAGVTDHGNLAGLTDDDHTQYLLADGTRALSGNWDMGAFNVSIDSPTFFVDSNNDRVGIGNIVPAVSLEVGDATGEEIIRASSGGNGNAILSANSFFSTGNPLTQYIVAGGNNWVTGVDNADSDKYKISFHITDLGTNNFLAIDSVGNVGINTSSPETLLHIGGVADSFQLKMSLDDASVGDWWGLGFAGRQIGGDSIKQGIVAERTESFGRGSIHFLINGAGDTSNADLSDARMTINVLGDVGIGTSLPNSTLHIKANIAGNVGSHSAGQLIIQNPADDVTSNAVITGYESDGSGNPDQQLWYLGSSSSS